VVLKGNLMTNPYALFRQTPQQLRRAGARGGKATARNRRARLSGLGLLSGKRRLRGCLTARRPLLPSQPWMSNFLGYAGRRSASEPSRPARNLHGSNLRTRTFPSRGPTPTSHPVVCPAGHRKASVCTRAIYLFANRVNAETRSRTKTCSTIHDLAVLQKGRSLAFRVCCLPPAESLHKLPLAVTCSPIEHVWTNHLRRLSR